MDRARSRAIPGLCISCFALLSECSSVRLERSLAARSADGTILAKERVAPVQKAKDRTWHTSAVRRIGALMSVVTAFLSSLEYARVHDSSITGLWCGDRRPSCVSVWARSLFASAYSWPVARQRVAPAGLARWLLPPAEHWTAVPGVVPARDRAAVPGPPRHCRTGRERSGSGLPSPRSAFRAPHTPRRAGSIRRPRHLCGSRRHGGRNAWRGSPRNSGASGDGAGSPGR
jgi:hypothetical protein